MMLDAILTAVSKEVDEELVRAREFHNPVFASNHEAYAVIKEELEEAECEHAHFKTLVSEFWTAVKCDDDALSQELLLEMWQIAERAAAEWIQVAAMCRKAMASVRE